jgi:hypothetical protein
MMRPEAIHVIYDGHGLFCVHSLGLFRLPMVGMLFRLHDAHSEKVIVTEGLLPIVPR